jgi:hypothetical protein
MPSPLHLESIRTDNPSLLPQLFAKKNTTRFQPASPIFYFLFSNFHTHDSSVDRAVFRRCRFCSSSNIMMRIRHRGKAHRGHPRIYVYRFKMLCVKPGREEPFVTDIFLIRTPGSSHKCLFV